MNSAEIAGTLGNCLECW